MRWFEKDYSVGSETTYIIWKNFYVLMYKVGLKTYRGNPINSKFPQVVIGSIL